MNKILFFIILTGFISIASIGALSTEFDLIPQDLVVLERDKVVACTCIDAVTGAGVACDPPIPSAMCPP
jgi:hypothetical protein